MNKVINFHDISDSSWFEDILLILKSKYSIVNIDEIEEFFYSDKKFKSCCHITFDDGDLTFYHLVYPILKRYNLPASIFVSPFICKEGKNFWFQEIKDYDQNKLKQVISEFLELESTVLNPYPVNAILKCLKIRQIWNIIEIYQRKFNVLPKEAQNMNVEQLREIDKYGLVKIGAHTNNHPILTNEDGLTSSNEITDSFKGLKEILGHEIKYFAYPNGYPESDFGKREIDILIKNNCRIAFSCETKNFTKQNHPLSVNRFGFTHGNKFFVKVKLFLGDYWDILRDLVKDSEIKTRIELEKKLLIKSRVIHFKGRSLKK